MKLSDLPLLVEYGWTYLNSLLSWFIDIDMANIMFFSISMSLPWLIMVLTNRWEDLKGGRESSGASSWWHLAMALFIETVYSFMFSLPQQLSIAFIFIHFSIISSFSIISAKTTPTRARSTRNFIFCG